jgi:hypothetical protein
MQLPGRRQRPMRSKHEGQRQAAEEYAAENQSLGKIQHIRDPCR